MAEEEHVPDPQDRRGEVSGSDVPGDPSGEGSTPSGADGSSGDDRGWPTENEAAQAAGDRGESGSGGAAEGAAEERGTGRSDGSSAPGGTERIRVAGGSEERTEVSWFGESQPSRAESGSAESASAEASRAQSGNVQSERAESDRAGSDRAEPARGSDRTPKGQRAEPSEGGAEPAADRGEGSGDSESAGPSTERLEKRGKVEQDEEALDADRVEGSGDPDSTGPGTERLEGNGPAASGEESGAAGRAETGRAETDRAETDRGENGPATERLAKSGKAEQVEKTRDTDRFERSEPRTERLEKPKSPTGDPADGPAGSPAEQPAEQTQRLPRVEPGQGPGPQGSSSQGSGPQGSGPPSPGSQGPAENEQPTQQFAVPSFDEPAEQERSPSADDSSLVASSAPLLPKPVRVADDPPPAPPGPGSSSAKPPAGPGRRNLGRLAVVWVSVLVVIGLAIGVVIGSNGLQKLSTASPPPPVQLKPAIHPVNGSAPLPGQQSLGSTLSGPASSPALGTFGGQVLDAQTGQQLWQHGASQPMTPASTGKLLAMSAAALHLDPQFRFTTKVVRGPTPGSVVLVGGGDPTLSTMPPGQQSIYRGAARMDDLAAQVKAATGGHVTSVLVDNSRYAGPSMAPGWEQSDISGGSVAPIEPVMVNGGRSDPTGDESPRTATPSQQAGQELARRVGAGSVGTGTAPPNAPPVGEVHSATAQDMTETVLTHSDNVLAEALARQVAVSTGNEPSFAGAVKAVREVLARNGFPMQGATMVDGSGLSTNDRLRPADIASLVEVASAPGDSSGNVPERTRKLRNLLAGLPVAGGTGSLASRYTDSAARGWVRAKTGTLNGANGLTGTALTQDGRLLVFAFISNGTSASEARPALDRVAEALRSCGCR